MKLHGQVCNGFRAESSLIYIAMLLLNVHTESFDNRPGVDAEGTIMANHEVGATLDLYDAIAVALHSRGIAMSRV
jgi:hypothetical protein